MNNNFTTTSMRIVTICLILFCCLAKSFGQGNEGRLKIAHLTGDFYVYTTYNLYQGNRIGANAMYLVTNKGVVLFDTPWDTTQFQPLLDSIKQRHNKKVVLCLATHFHEDRTGGLQYYRGQDIKTYTTKRTDALSKEKGMKRAQFLIDKDTLFKVGQYSFQTYFPGPGHAPDNIVIWFEKEKVLYGGCLVKSVEDKNLGNLADADTKGYATTIKKVQQQCSNPRFIITGHNDYTNTKSLEHTLRLAQELELKN